MLSMAGVRMLLVPTNVDNKKEKKKKRKHVGGSARDRMGTICKSQ